MKDLSRRSFITGLVGGLAGAVVVSRLPVLPAPSPVLPIYHPAYGGTGTIINAKYSLLRPGYMKVDLLMDNGEERTEYYKVG